MVGSIETIFSYLMSLNYVSIGCFNSKASQVEK
jgi:hypothetical protein